MKPLKPLTRRHYYMLGKVFTAEGEGRLPYQTKAKIMLELSGLGMVGEETRFYGGRFPVTVMGWSLTERGRLAYCQWAATQDEDA